MMVDKKNLNGFLFEITRLQVWCRYYITIHWKLYLIITAQIYKTDFWYVTIYV